MMSKLTPYDYHARFDNVADLARFILLRENHSPGFIHARETIHDYAFGIEPNWEDLSKWLIENEAGQDFPMPISTMLTFGLQPIWDAARLLLPDYGDED